MVPRFCERCGGPIKSMKRKARFCSRACSAKASSKTRDYSKTDPAILDWILRDPDVRGLISRQVRRFHRRRPWVDIDVLYADALVGIWQALSTAKLDSPKDELLAYLAKGIWFAFCKFNFNADKVMLNSVSADVLAEGVGDPGTRGEDAAFLEEVLDYIESKFGREWRAAMLALGEGATLEDIGVARGVTKEAIRQKTEKIRRRLAKRFGRGLKDQRRMPCQRTVRSGNLTISSASE